MRERKNIRKIISGAIVSILMLSAILVFYQLGVENVSGYSTPNTGVVWSMDQLESNAGPTVITSPPGPGGPYEIHESITIRSLDTIRVLAGDELRFDDTYSLIVDGTLSAVGSLLNRVIFTSNSSTPFPGIWNGIYFNVASG
jgi:hypothetical protein